jgi:hypothetical protein
MTKYIFKAVAPWNIILAGRGKRFQSQNCPSPSVDPIAFLGLPDCHCLLQMTHNISQKLLRWKQLLNLILIWYLWLFFDMPVTFNLNKILKILFSTTLVWYNLT